MSLVDELVDALRAFYGVLPAPPRRLFPMFVWEVLDARTSPARRDAAFNALKRIPALTPDAMWRAPEARLVSAVALAGPYREQRLGALRAGVSQFRRTPGLDAALRRPLRSVRLSIKSLPSPGGEAAAHRLLLFAGDHRVFPADRGVQRVALRLGWVPAVANARRAARVVRRAFAERLLSTGSDGWREASLYFSHHAKLTCTDLEPHCQVCPLLPHCADGRRRVSSGTPRADAAS